MTATLLVLTSVAGFVSRAQGQAPDIRSIKPLLMLVIDTSGSMERMPDCICSSEACTECLPNCTGSGDPAYEKNRWAIALEALTGTWSSFECEAYDRTGGGWTGFDLDYYMPYHQPWKCASYSGLPCDNTGTQNSDGLLDAYVDSIRFGLMTFDSKLTYAGADDLVAQSLFSQVLSAQEDGHWSYGSSGRTREGHGTVVGRLNFPGCPTPYLVDTGGRNADATGGALITALSETDMAIVNADIQEALLDTRPYGGTPVAAALDDLIYYFENLEDEMVNCRERHVLLLTDGYPDQDFRDISGCDCSSVSECCEAYNNLAPGAGACNPAPPEGTWPAPDAYNPAQYQCPYPTPEEVASALLNGYDDNGGVADKLHVVGFALPEGGEGDEVRALLDTMAENGGTEQALFADNLAQLQTTLGEVLDALAADPVSRTVPAFASGTGSGVTQYQFATGFNVDDEGPWSGILERKRFVCVDGEVTEPDLETEDRFHEVLNSRTAARDLWTVIPDSGTVRDHLTKGESGDPCGVDGCDKVKFLSSVGTVTADHLELEGDEATQAARRTEIMNWVHGTTEERASKRLGDIYHSSPAISSPPRYEVADDAFNTFRQKTEVAARPQVLYVGTNDGILHAFATEGVEPDPENSVGTEMWGFVPPILLPKLDSAVNLHQAMVDGTPVLKNVYLSRIPSATPCDNPEGEADYFCNYRTVLLAGLRGGERAYFALDTTDPTDCMEDAPTKCGFLWQFTHPDLGYSYGKPALAQVAIEWNDVVMERAVAILPGGTGTLANSGSCPSLKDASNQVFKTLDEPGGSPTHSHRASVRCWEPVTVDPATTPAPGRSVFIVDVETGTLIKQIDETIFPSPVVGSPALYRGDEGTLATRAFVTDIDGVIWRIDLSGTDPEADEPDEGWTARPFHDIFWNRAHDEAEASYEPPALSVDSQGRVVVIHATGDTEDFEDTDAVNYVVSLTEEMPSNNADPDPEDVKAAFNWEIRLEEGELITGPLELFDGKVFFSSFVVVPESEDPCDLGTSRLFAVDYVQRDTDQPNTGTPVTYYPEEIAIGSPFNEDTGLQNQLFMGVGITKRPQCPATTTTVEDPYLGQTRLPIPEAVAAVFEVVAHVSGGTQEQGSALGTQRYAIPSPQTLTRVGSFTGSCD